MQFALSGGRPTISQLTSVADTSCNWASGEPECVLPASVTVGTTPTAVTWVYDGATATARQVEFAYHCDNPSLKLVSRWTSTALPGPVEHNVLLTNQDSRNMSLSMPYATALKLRRQAGHSYDHWSVEKASGDYAPEGPRAVPITGSYQTTLLCGPYSTDMDSEFDTPYTDMRDEIPWLCINDTTAGSVVYGGIEYSAWTVIDIKNNADYIDAKMGLKPTMWETTTTTPLAAGITLTYPPTFVGVCKGDVDDSCNRLHRWVEQHLRPPVPGGITPLIVNNTWGVGFGINETKSKAMIDSCAALGMEMFHLDAGWYKEVGDWHADTTKFPSGMASLAAYAHSKSVKFGLWVAWAQGGDMKTYNNEMLTVFNPTQAPWFTQAFAGNWTSQSYSGATVCLADPGAVSWCVGELHRIANSYSIDMLEHDQPVIPDQGCKRTAHPHTANDWVDTSRAACDGYYSVYDQLRQVHPGLWYEDCDNGGRLVDYGVAKRTHYYSVSDINDAIALRQVFYDASYPMPPSMLELYLDHNTDANQLLMVATTSFVYMLRSCLLGWPTIQCDTTTWDTTKKNAAMREFGFFKNKLRPLIANGNIYHVLPRPSFAKDPNFDPDNPDDPGWDGVEYYDPATGKGALMVFRPYSTVTQKTIKLKGLSPTKNYLVESADGGVSTQTLSGTALMTSGVTVNLPAQNSSDMVFLTATDTVGADTIAPSINSVTVSPALAASGDWVTVTVDAADDVGVVSVTADGLQLAHTTGNHWVGCVPAAGATGDHSVSASASDAAGNVTSGCFAAYKTAPICGANRGALYDSCAKTAAGNFLFKVWGTAHLVDSDIFTLSTAQAYPVTVLAPGYTLAEGNFAAARGVLQPGAGVPMISSSAALVQVLH